MDAYAAERQFREVLGWRQIVLYHATRLLPHEIEGVRDQGLLTLTQKGRDQRLDEVIMRYDEVIGFKQLEALRNSGPLARNEQQRSARLGNLYGVTPLEDAFADGGDSMTVFLKNWGGESFYWAAYSDEAIAETIRELTRESIATIVEFAVATSWLKSYSCLWQIFVGQLDGRKRPCGEFRICQSIPSERILELLHECSPKWPVAVGTLAAL